MNNLYDADLIISSLGRGGAERVCVTIANELCNSGYNVRIITLYASKKNYISDLNNKISYMCLDGKNYIHGLLKLSIFLNKSNMNKIVAFGEKITSICNYIKIKKKKKYIVISRVVNNVDIQEKDNKNIIYSFLFKFAKKYMKYSNKIIFQCNSMKDRMYNYFNLDANNKCYVVYNPLSSSFENIEPLNNKDEYFLMVGRLVSQKGYSYLIETMKKVVKINKNIVVKILGDGPLKEELQNEININNLNNNIFLLGNINNVIDYYINAKALLLTSTFEGFPNVLLEANACGCPVISFNCPTGPNEIINKYNGLLIKYLDVDQLASAITKFDSIKWDYKKIVLSTKKYNSKKIMKEYIDIINN